MSVTSGAVPIPCRASRAQDAALADIIAQGKALPAGIVELDELKVAVANRAGGTASEKMRRS